MRSYAEIVVASLICLLIGVVIFGFTMIIATIIIAVQLIAAVAGMLFFPSWRRRQRPPITETLAREDLRIVGDVALPPTAEKWPRSAHMRDIEPRGM